MRLTLLLLVSCKLLGQYDVLVYRATPAGISAAVAVSREGLSVAIVEPALKPGGMMTNGLSASDVCLSRTIGGFAREFFESVGRRYGKKIAWYFEPKVALSVFNDYLRSIQVFYETNISSVNKIDNRITSVTTSSGVEIHAKVFIDASYEGDLMAKSGVSYRLGRESSSEFNEPWAGVRLNSRKDQFAKNARSRDAKNRMYKGVNSSSLNAKGSGDKGIMAYNYRLCFTKSHRNKVRFRRPQNYSRSNYLLLLEDIGTREVKDINQILLFVEIPNKKFDINNRGPFSTNLVGGSWNYPESSWDERRIIEERHKRHIQGLLYFISNDRAVPLKIRQGLRRFGLCKDEFTDNDNWPSQIYVRSGRRLVGEYTMTQHDIQRARRHRDSIGLGSCPIEVHSVQRVETKERFVRNEGGVFEFVKRVFSVPYRSIVPKKSEASNLLVSVALSATHIAQSAIRMEPTYMIIGQSAGIGAAIAIRDNVAVQDIDYSKLKRRLIEVGQRL